MKIFTFLVFCSFICIFQIASAEIDSLVIDISNGKRLNEYIDESQMRNVKYLKLTGYLNAHDLDVIYNKMCGFIENRTKTGYIHAGSLRVLDMSGVRLVDPSSPLSNSYIGPDFIPEKAFCIEYARVGTILEELFLPNCNIGRDSFRYSFDLKKVVIPEGTKIGAYSFTFCHSLDSIMLPNSIGSDVVWSFRGDRMKAYKVKPTNTLFSSINGALCSKDGKTLYSVPWGLDKFVIPSSVTQLTDVSFNQHPNIETICLGENVSVVNEDCFQFCPRLSRIIMTSENVPTIKTSPYYDFFYGCSKLVNSGTLYVPKGTSSLYSIAPGWSRIPNIVEYEASNLESIIDEEVEETGDFDFKDNNIYYKVISVPDLSVGVCNGPKDYEGNIVIPSKVNYRNREFDVVSVIKMSGRNLKSVQLPNSIESIGSFYGTGLVSIIIPNSVTSIAAGAFANCQNLEYIKVSDNVLKLERRLFEHCSMLKKVVWNPKSTAYISGHTFWECNSLTTFTIPSYVISTGYNTDYTNECSFGSCASLDTLIVQDSENNLRFGMEENHYLTTNYEKKYGEFFLCNIKNLYLGRSYSYLSVAPNLSVQNLTIGDAVTNLKYWPAVYKSLTIGKSLVSIPSFSDKNLATITVRNITPPIAIGFSNETYMNATLYVPKGSKANYLAADVWKNFWNIEEFDISTSMADVNHDGEVNIADINTVINSILSSDQNMKCDVNNDKEVNIADVNSIINIILNN